jgi:hypothetical protein
MLFEAGKTKWKSRLRKRLMKRLGFCGLGFQYRACGFFLIAGASSLAFWATEAVTKRHQMRNYVRIREIAVNRYWTAPEERAYSAPRMNWSWHQAKLIFLGKGKSLKEEIIKYRTQLSR